MVTRNDFSARPYRHPVSLYAGMTGTPEAAGVAGRRKGAARGDDALWSFGPEGSAITVRHADILLAHLPLFLTGWPIKRIDAGGDDTADIDVIQQAGDKFLIVRRGAGADEQLFDDEFNAANGLSGALVAAYVARQPDKVCFHASSAKVGPGLVVLLGDSLAGKSSVALHLAASGYRLFGDDRLAVSFGETGAPMAQCLGLTPKIRLPLPDDCGQHFAEYIDAFTEVRDDSSVYLKLWEGEAAVFLEKAPVTAFVILERRETGPCALLPTSRPEIAKTLLSTCFSPHVETTSLVPAMTQLASAAGGHKLSFSSSREAAAMLAAALRDGKG